MTDSAVEEIAKLTRQIRGLRRLVVIATFTALAAALLATVAVTEIGGARDLTISSLSLRDGTGRERVRLAVKEGEPSINFLNGQGHVLVTAGITPQHQPHIGMLSDTGALKVALGTAEDSSPTIALFGLKNRPLAGLSVVGQDQPVLQLRSATSSAQATLGAHPNDQFALQIMDHEGQVVGSHVSVEAP